MSFRLIGRFLDGCLLALALISISGCGGVYDAKVSGEVKLDGASLPRGTVTFAPTGKGPAAYAQIDGGTYTVYTGREVGLPAGEYQVTVVANEPAATKETENGGPPPLGKAITPPWYGSKDTSGLKFTVNKGRNTIDLDLKSQPPAGWKPPPGRKT